MAISRRSRRTLIAGHVQAQSGRTIHVDDGQAWGWSRERGRERRNATYAGGPAGGRVRHSVGWVIGGKVRPVQKDSTVGFSSSFPTDPLPAGRLQEAPTVQHMTSDSHHQPMPREGMGAWLVFAASCSLLLFIERPQRIGRWYLLGSFAAPPILGPHSFRGCVQAHPLCRGFEGGRMYMSKESADAP